MEGFAGKVAVVTGAASGIGLGLAERFCAEGMKVVLADVETEALAAAQTTLRDAGAEVVALETDVSDRAAVDALADAAYDRFGAVHVLCNNAGVSGGGGPVWETTPNDWTWVLGVNLLGVVHGIQAFVPRMVAGGQEGHVVNTSSIMGLVTGGGSIYGVTKHGVVRLSEGLYHDLRAAGSPIGVSVLCPGMIATNIVSSQRNRPAILADPERPVDPERERFREAMQKRFLDEGMPPSEVAEITMEAIRTERFYVFTHPEMKAGVEARFRSIMDDTAPPGQAGMMQDLRGRGGS